jgi:hypothetical protein
VCLARNVEEELRLGRIVAREGWEVTTATGDELAGETVITDTGGGD